MKIISGGKKENNEPEGFSDIIERWAFTVPYESL
jgi:hypothetical protein